MRDTAWNTEATKRKYSYIIIACKLYFPKTSSENSALPESLNEHSFHLFVEAVCCSCPVLLDNPNTGHEQKMLRFGSGTWYLKQGLRFAAKSTQSIELIGTRLCNEHPPQSWFSHTTGPKALRFPTKSFIPQKHQESIKPFPTFICSTIKVTNFTSHSRRQQALQIEPFFLHLLFKMAEPIRNKKVDFPTAPYVCFLASSPLDLMSWE
jgi:hypothetical protein